MTIPITDAKGRICAILKETFAAQTPAVAVDCAPYAYHVQASFPYFIMRTARADHNDNPAEDTRFTTRIVELAMHVGYRGEGYANLNFGHPLEERTDEYIEIVLNALWCTRGQALKTSASGAYPTAPLYLSPFGIRVTADLGFIELGASTTGGIQVGTVFQIEVPLRADIGGR